MQRITISQPFRYERNALPLSYTSMVDSGGLEPPEFKTTDLQSVPLPVTGYLSKLREFASLSEGFTFLVEYLSRFD